MSVQLSIRTEGTQEGLNGGGPHVGCRLKFYYFVGFDLCRLSVNPS